MKRLFGNVILAAGVVVLAAFAGGLAISAIIPDADADVNQIDPLPPMPDETARRVLSLYATYDRVIVMAPRVCGSPFAQTVNYLASQYRAGASPLAGSVVVTLRDELPRLRELRDRFGASVVDNRTVIASTVPFGDVLIIEPGRDRRPVVHQLGPLPTRELAGRLSEILGSPTPGSTG